MIYKCKNCGGALEYSAELNKMYCEHCGTSFTIEELTEKNSGEEESSSKQKSRILDTGSFFDFTNPNGFASNEVGDYKTVLERKEEEKKREEERQHAYVKMQIMRCTSCGAELAVNSVETSSFCAYCGQATVVADRVEDYLQPDYIIPFKVNKNDAERIIRSRLNSGFFVPNGIKNFEPEKIRGIYVPFWLFDIYYHDKQMYQYTKKQGKTTVKKYEYFEGETNFTRITCDASKNLNDDSSTRLEPYDMRQLVDFDMAYLAGYYSDRFDLGYIDLTGTAVTKAMGLYDAQVMESELRHKSGTLISRDPDYHVNKTEYALLPAWFITFRYENKPYTFLVNGQTGKMVGAVPINKAKAITLFISLAVVLSLMLVLVCTALAHFFFIQVGFDEKLTFVYLITCPLLAFLFVKGAIHRYELLMQSLALTTAKQINKFAKERTDK